MQKVEGSSPFIRSLRKPRHGGVFSFSRPLPRLFLSAALEAIWKPLLG